MSNEQLLRQGNRALMLLERIPSGGVIGPFVDNRHSRAGGNPLDVQQKSEPDAEG